MRKREITSGTSLALAAVALCAGALATVPARAQGGSEPGEPSEAACETLSFDHGKSSLSSKKIKSCCGRVFREAAPQARHRLELGLIRLDAAAKGKLVCVDELQADPARAKPVYKLRRRNVIAGEKTGLHQVSAVAFAEIEGRPQLLVAGSAGSRERILGFNPRFDGNVSPDREWSPKGLSPASALSADSRGGIMAILGADGKIRRVSLRYNDRGLKPEEKSRIDGLIAPEPALADPISVGVSGALQRVFVLTADGQVHVFAGEGKVAEETSFPAEGVSRPTGLRVEETAKDVKVKVFGSDGRFFEASYSLR